MWIIISCGRDSSLNQIDFCSLSRMFVIGQPFISLVDWIKLRRNDWDVFFKLSFDIMFMILFLN